MDEESQEKKEQLVILLGEEKRLMKDLKEVRSKITVLDAEVGVLRAQRTFMCHHAYPTGYPCRGRVHTGSVKWCHAHDPDRAASRKQQRPAPRKQAAEPASYHTIPPGRCLHCGQPKDDHRAKTMSCPSNRTDVRFLETTFEDA